MLETLCRCVRGKIRLARGDLDSALADGAAAYDLTRARAFCERVGATYYLRQIDALLDG